MCVCVWMDGIRAIKRPAGSAQHRTLCVQNRDEASALAISTEHRMYVCRLPSTVYAERACRREVRVARQGWGPNPKEQPAAETDRTGEPCPACTCESRLLPEGRREPRGNQTEVWSALEQQAAGTEQRDLERGCS